MKIFVLMLLMAGQAQALVGDAGCGMGSLFMDKNTKALQTLAITSNWSSYTQFLGIISGTSNCKSSGFVNNDKEIEYFVEVNQDDLIRQMAQGQGEKLQILAQFYGCRSTESQKAFFSMTKSSYREIVNAADMAPSAFIQNLDHQMNFHAELDQLCEKVIL